MRVCLVWYWLFFAHMLQNRVSNKVFRMQDVING